MIKYYMHTCLNIVESVIVKTQIVWKVYCRRVYFLQVVKETPKYTVTSRLIVSVMEGVWRFSRSLYGTASTITASYINRVPQNKEIWGGWKMTVQINEFPLWRWETKVVKVTVSGSRNKCCVKSHEQKLKTDQE